MSAAGAGRGSSSTASHVPEKWRVPVLAVWLLIAAGYLVLLVIGLQTLYQLSVSPLPGYRPQGWPIEFLDITASFAQLGVSGHALGTFLVANDVVGFLLFGAVGVMILLRNSDEWIGVYSSLLLLSLGVAFTNGANVLAEQLASSIPLVELFQGLPWIGFFVYLTVFPDGRFVPRWTAVTGLVGLILVVLAAFTPVPMWDEQPSLSLIMAILGIGVAAAIYRYLRVSDPLQRQQTKWVVAAFAGVFIYSILFFFVVPSYFTELIRPGRPLVAFQVIDTVVGTLVFALVPISIGIAITRYRLWDVDRVINRGLVYSLLSGLLVGIYLLAVAMLQLVLRSLTGQESPLAIVASTLLIAALFNPLRQRIQAVIDRRLYRRKYDASQTLEKFGEIVRDQVNLDDLSGTLLEVVEQSVQPERVTLWLKRVK